LFNILRGDAVNLSAARRLFGDRGSEYQLSAEALAALALHLDEEGREITERVLDAVDEENRLRGIHKQPPKRRIIAEDVRRAMGR
jgi:hypothetical protein